LIRLKNLLPESQNILSGTRTFTSLYNKDIVPQVNKLFNLINAQGGLAAGKMTSAKIRSLMGKNSEVNKTRVALLNSLKDLSGSYRQAGGDRATMGQIQLNIDQLTDQLKHGNMNEAAETLNKLSQMVYDKGNAIVNSDLAPVKKSYPKFEIPQQLVWGELTHHAKKRGFE
jgi:hypothetical protein